MLSKIGVNSNPSSAMFISKQSPAMFSLLINPNKLTNFSKFVSDGSKRKQVRREIEQIRDNFLTKTKLNYENDLKEWLGDEITIAVTSLDFDHDSENGIKPGYLLAVKNRDSELAKEFLQVYYNPDLITDDREIIFESYQGVNLIYKTSSLSSEKNQAIASAVVGNFVLFANDIKVLKDAINNAQAFQLNLANYEPYQEAVKTISDPKISLGYLNIPAFSAWIGKSNTIENNNIQQTLTLSLSVNPQGLITHTALFGAKGNENKNPLLSSPSDTLNYIPENSIVVASGINLKEFGEEIATGLPQNSPIQQIINQGIQTIEKSLNINLAENIFNNIEKEYSISLLNNSQNNQLDWVFVTENEEINLMENLDKLANTQGLSVGNLPLFDTTMTAWTRLITTSENDFTSLKAEVKGVHTNIDEYSVLTNSVDILMILFIIPIILY